MDINEMLGIDLKNPLHRDAVAMEDNDERLLGDLVGLRDRRGLTQQQVADRMGISQPAIARLEAGGRDLRMSTVRRYALAVGAVVDHVVHEGTPRAGRTALPETDAPATGAKVFPGLVFDFGDTVAALHNSGSKPHLVRR
jgi:transcriptional regulator with XRE-family HTH domain